MTKDEALKKALTALDDIDKLAEVAMNGHDDPADTVNEIHSITGSLIGDLARAGYKAEVEA
jgi:hypothetical protein